MFSGGSGYGLLLVPRLVLSLGGEPESGSCGWRVGARRGPGSQRAEGEGRLYPPRMVWDSVFSRLWEEGIDRELERPGKVRTCAWRTEIPKTTSPWCLGHLDCGERRGLGSRCRILGWARGPHVFHSQPKGWQTEPSLCLRDLSRS